jgi:energy-coupling factor transporter ATP-binding protein EcfA2
MKISVERIIIKNRAPFENLDLTFNENEIAVLTAVNGRGKTTLISYIVDAWHEIARPHFSQTFEGKENKYYRVSSPIYNLDTDAPSFVYIRFKYDNEQIDYVDIRGKCTSQQYNDAIPLGNKILFNEINQILEDNSNVKKTSKSLDKKKAIQVFNNNVITYFPAYRYEIPGYLNDPYKVNLNFTKEFLYSGYLENPLEVTTGLPQLANWIMDVVLDMELYKQPLTIQQNGQPITLDASPERNVLWNSLRAIIAATLSSKKYEGIRFGIGKRNSGGTRISIMSDKVTSGKTESEPIYPTIFNMSSGEAAMLCLFGEILRQSDKINKSSSGLQNVTGIVLIDEIDKHLHIKLSNEVLPQLFNLFPNVQFIVSSHSPFLNMGIAKNAQTNARATIIDLDQNGIRIPVQENSLYQEVYQMMISENENYAKMYEELSSEHEKPILFVEDTYTQIYKVAWLKLNDVDFDEHDIEEKFKNEAGFCIYGKGNKDNLQGFLSNPCMSEWVSKKVAGLFDFDDAYENFQRLKDNDKNKIKWEIVSDDENAGLCKKRKDCDVYALMLPIPSFRKNIAGKKQKVKQLEVELLLKDEKIKEAYGEADYATEIIIEGVLEIPEIKNKADFWKKAMNLDKKAFEAFTPLFDLLEKNIFLEKAEEV